MTKECEYKADERPALTLTKKGRKSATSYGFRSYTLTDAARAEMNQPLPMDQYPVVTVGEAK